MQVIKFEVHNMIQRQKEFSEDSQNSTYLTTLLMLPDEIILYILSFLPKNRSKLVPVSMTCLSLFRIANDERLLQLFASGYDCSKISSHHQINDMGQINTGCLSPDEKTIAVAITEGNGSTSSKIILLNAKTGEQITTLETPGIGYNSLSYTNDNKHIIACDRMGTIDIWNLQTRKKTKTFGYERNKFGTTLVSCISENEFVVGERSGEPLRLYQLNNDEYSPFKAFKANDGKEIRATEMCLSRDGKLLAIKDGDCRFGNTSIHVYDTESKKFIKKISDVSGYTKNIHFSNDNNDIIFIDSLTISHFPHHKIKNSIKIVNIDSEEIKQFEPGVDNFDAFSMHQSGQLILITGFTGSHKPKNLMLFNIETGETDNSIFGDFKKADFMKVFFNSHGSQMFALTRDSIYIFKFKLAKLQNNAKIENNETPSLTNK